MRRRLGKLVQSMSLPFLGAASKTGERLEAAMEYLSSSQNNYEFDELLVILELLPESDKMSLLRTWSAKEGNNFNSERLDQVQSIITNQANKVSLAMDNLRTQNDFSYEFLKKLLVSIEKEHFSIKSAAITNWIRNSSHNITFDILERELLPLVGDRKSNLIHDWLRKHPKNNFDFPYLKQRLLPLVADEEVEEKDEMLLEWLKKEDNNFDFSFFENTFLLPKKSSYSKFQATKTWLEKEQNNCDVDFLERTLSLVEERAYNSDSDKSGLLKTYLEKEGNNFDFGFFRKILPSMGHYKFDIFRRWNEKSENIIPTKSIAEILSEFENPHHKYLFAKAALEKNNDQINYELITAIIPLAENERERTELTKTCLERLEYNFDIEFLQKAILPLIEDFPSRLLAIKTFFEIPDNFDSRSAQDVKFLKEIIRKESPDNASAIIKNCLKSGHKCDLAFLKDVMESAGIKASNNQHNRSDLVKYWFKNTAISCDLDYIKSEIIPLVGDDGNKFEIIKSSIEKFDENFVLQSEEGLRTYP